MKRHLRIIAVLLVVSLVPTPLSSSEAAESSKSKTKHFTFRVPVKLANVHADFDKLLVSVWTMDTPNPAECWTTPCQVGWGAALHQVVDGAVDQTFVVSFDAKPGRHPSEAKSWRAFFSFKVGAEWQSVCSEVTRPDGPYPRDTTRPCIDTVSGTLP